MNRLSFALLLPALEIAIWLVLVPTQTGLIYWRLKHGTPASAFHDREVFHSDQILVLNLPRVEAQTKPSAPEHPIFDLALFASTYPHGILMTAINMPGMFGEMLVDLPTTWPDSWHPASLMLMSWRTIIMPFYCLPFWWFVGVGLDTATGRRLLRWGWLLLGTILFLLFTAALAGFVGMAISEPAREDAGFLLSGTGFWTLAFSAFPAAWILQRRRSKAALSVSNAAEKSYANG